MVTRLEIGTTRKRPDLLTVDASDGADVKAMVPPLPAEVTRQQWSEISMSHFLEHLFPADAERLLRECRRVIAPDGVMVVEVPNVLYVCEAMLGLRPKPDDTYGILALYGNVRRGPLMAHRWGYTPETLRAILSRCGFGGFEEKPVRHPSRDIRIAARPC